MDYGLIFGQDKDDHLTLKKNIEADYISFAGDRAGWPAAPLEGEMFYNSALKALKYYDGTAWKDFGGAGGGPKTVASKIVAASNSLDKTSADYICDGTDDQVEIQTAIDALGTIGGTIYLLEGTYNISGSINLDNIAPNDSNKAIIGAGAGTVLKVNAAGDYSVINASSVEQILISQLMVDINGVGLTCINFSSTNNSKIHSVWVTGSTNSVFIDLSSSSNNTISKNNINANGFGASGITLRDSSNNNIVSGNVIRQTYTAAIRVTSSYNNIVSGNAIQAIDRSGIIIACNPPDSNLNTVFGNTVQGCGLYGIQLNGSFSNTVTGNTLQGNRFGIAIASAWYNTVSGNTLAGNTEHSFYLGGCLFSAIVGNKIHDSGGDGIYLYSSASNNLISGNDITDTAGTSYAINISSSDCNTNYLVGNCYSGTGAALISDSGTNTKYTDKTKMTLEKKEISGGIPSPLDVTTNPQSYVRLIPSAAITLTLANGKSAGDLLIIENGSSSNNITINDAGNLSLEGKLILGLNDTLELIWNGSKWLEIKYMNNL